jgi:pyruvate dehydrogenase E2 component (dihydrolipoamide acetyltransferase)
VAALAKGTSEPITRRDIEAIDASKSGSVATDFRTAIAAAMTRSKKEIPHYYLSHDIDLTIAERFVATENAKREPADRLLMGAVCAKAVAAAVAKFPEFNGHYANNSFHPSKPVNLGFAINLRSGGLVAPALFDAESLSLNDLMLNLRNLTKRVRAGRFRARELSDATITLTSLGERGTDAVFGVIYPPQVAIVGMGAARARPAVVNGELAIRTMATFTLAADHRVSDGHRGALFLRAIDKELQTPEVL